MGADLCPYIVLSLKQAMNDHRLVGEDPFGRDLEPDQGDDERIAVGFPPALLASRSGELDQLVPAPGFNTVELEHVSNVPGRGADLAVFDPRHLGVAAFEKLGGLVDGLAGGLPKVAKFHA